MRKRVAIIVNNDITYDNRVKRYGKTLWKAGYDVKLFGRTNSMQPEFTYLDDIPCVKLPYSYRNFSRFLFNLFKVCFSNRHFYLNYTRILNIVLLILSLPIFALLSFPHIVIKVVLVKAFRKFYRGCHRFIRNNTHRFPKLFKSLLYLLINNRSVIKKAFFIKNANHESRSLLSQGRNSFFLKILKVIDFLDKLLLSYITKLFGVSIVYEESVATLIDSIIQYSPDIIHSNDLDTLRVGYLAAKKLHIPFIYDSHEFERDRSDRKSLITKIQIICEEKSYISKAATVITVSDGIAKLLKTIYDLKFVEVVYNAPEVTKNNKYKKDIKVNLKLNAKQPLLVYVGLITYGRGLEAIIEALTYLDGWHIAFIGPHNREFLLALNTLIRRLKLGKRVTILDPISSDKLTMYLKTADVGVIVAHADSISHNLSMPNKLFEMSLAGVPLVVSPLKEIKEYVLKNNIGLVLPENYTPKDIASKVKQVYNTPAYRSAKTLKALCKTYGFKEQEKKIKAIYNNLLYNHRHR